MRRYAFKLLTVILVALGMANLSHAADIKISDMTTASALTGAENTVIVQSAANRKVTTANLIGGTGTGLVINTAGVPSLYAGASCTNQVVRLLGASGAATCVTITSAYVDTSVWTGTVSSGILKANSQGVLAQAVSGTDYVVPAGNTATATALAANGGNCSAGQFPLGVDTLGAVESCTALPTTIAGTTNEITASAATGPVTLSLASVVNLSSKTIRIPNGTALPGTCVLGDQFMDTDATLGQQHYLCTSANTWTLQGDGGGGGAGTVTSVDATGGVETASGSAITTSGTIRGAMDTRASVSATDTILTGDRGKVVTHSDATAVAVTLPQAGAGFEDKWYYLEKNIGVGDVTITPTTSTINGDTDLVLTTNQWALIVSDGTNYTALVMNGLTAEADTLATVNARGRSDFGATSAANCVKIGKDSSNYWCIYHDVTDGLQFVAVVAGVANDADYYRKLNAGKKGGFKDSSGNVDFEYTESTGKISAMTVDAEDSGVAITLTEEHHFPVATCQNATASTNFDTPTANAPAATCDTGTNTQKGYLAFDATTDESFQDSWILPTGFTGAIDVHLRWKAAATTGSVAWCAQLIRVADGATSDPAFPAQATGNCVSDAAKGTTLQENTATISGVTCTSCAAGDHVYVRISRDPDSTSTRTDDMTGDALLLAYGRTWRVAH